MVIGNYLPKVKQNNTIGIRVVYIVSIMAAAIISILYSYLFYKKKLATGEGLKIQYNTKKV